MTMMPSIALPTGPYDWHEREMPRAVFERRLDAFRRTMAHAGVGLAIVHGNGFDHGALLWLTHFTPKLGPAYALVPAAGPLRLLFAGGPGMKPSAQRLTWVADVVALKGIEADAKRWLAEQGTQPGAAVGLVEGASMLRGDWRAVQRAAGVTAALDAEVLQLLSHAALEPAGKGQDTREAQRALRACRERLEQIAVPGADLRLTMIEAERVAYAAGAQDVRWRIARRPGQRPSTPPDDPAPLAGPTAVVLAVRHSGAWQEVCFVLRG